jgi:hypothetical protein
MDAKNYNTDDERKFYENAEKLTDRELQEKQAYYLAQLNKNTLNIKNNVQFWFYATIISTALAILILGNQ